MAQLHPESQLVQDSPQAFNGYTSGDQLQPQWPTRMEATITATAAVVPDDHHLTSQDDQHHEKKSVLKKVKDKAKKLKASLTKSKEHGHDHGNEVRDGESGYAEDEEDDDYDDEEESSPSLQGGAGKAVEGVTQSMSGLDAFGTRDPLPKVTQAPKPGTNWSTSGLDWFGTPDPFPKDPEAPKPPTDWTSLESNSSTGCYDPPPTNWTSLESNSSTGCYDPRAATDRIPSNKETAMRRRDLSADPGEQSAGVTPNLQPIQARSAAEPDYIADSRRPEIMPALAHPGKEVQKLDHGSNDAVDFLPVSTPAGHRIEPQDISGAIPDNKKKAYRQDELDEKAVRDPTEVAAGAPITDNVRIPEGIMKPTKQKPPMGSPFQRVNEGKDTNMGEAMLMTQREKFVTDVGIPSITQQAREELANLNKFALDLGHGQQMDGKRKPIFAKVKKTMVATNDLPSQNEDSHSLKSRGARASDELKYVSSELVLQGSIAPQQEKYVSSHESKPQEEGSREETIIRNEEPQNADGGGWSVLSGIGSSVMEKTIGMTQGLKESLPLDFGGGKNTNSEECVEKVGGGVHDGERKGYAQKIYDTAASAKNAISSKLGYGGSEPTVREEKPRSLAEENDGVKGTVDREIWGAPESHNTGKSSVADKLSPPYDKPSSAKDAITSKLGYGGQSDVEKEKPKSIAGEKYIKNEYKATTLDDDVAVVESNQMMRNSQGNAYEVSKIAVFGKGSIAGNKADASEGSPGAKGMVDRVTGVVSSLLGMTREEQPLSPKPSDTLGRESKEHSEAR